MFHTIRSIVPICRKLHAVHRKLVLATGFFDLLHAEHLNFLKKAKAAGDILIVAVESDARARAVKGEGRPAEPQAVRCQKVASHADYVIALGDDFDNQASYESLLSAVHPDLYAVSSHTSHLENKRILTEKYGGKLAVVHAFNPAVSTSQIINR